VKRLVRFLPTLLLGCAWAAAMACLAGCSLPAVSPAERAYSLVAGVNAVSRDALADSFLPSITNYSSLLDPTVYPAFWEANFPYTNAPYTVTVLDDSDPAAVTLCLADSKGSWGPMNLALVMDRIGNDWFIRELRMDPSPAPAATVVVPLP
jgi:hypothetical protein